MKPSGALFLEWKQSKGLGVQVREVSRRTQGRGRALLGNVVISKKFLRTRKIMVMHSNERGEYDLRTLKISIQKIDREFRRGNPL